MSSLLAVLVVATEAVIPNRANRQTFNVMPTKVSSNTMLKVLQYMNELLQEVIFHLTTIEKRFDFILCMRRRLFRREEGNCVEVASALLSAAEVVVETS